MNQPSVNESTIAARDTTFDNVKAESVWIGVTNMKKDGKLHVVLEVDGIQKSIWSMKPSYAEPSEGMVNDFTQVTWVVKKALKAFADQLAEKDRRINELEAALKKADELLADCDSELSSTHEHCRQWNEWVAFYEVFKTKTHK